MWQADERPANFAAAQEAVAARAVAHEEDIKKDKDLEDDVKEDIQEDVREDVR